MIGQRTAVVLLILNKLLFSPFSKKILIMGLLLDKAAAAPLSVGVVFLTGYLSFSM